ncbi:hypothetical protein AA106555_1609 [Neokomagataea thailandica NBRC 106555]|uniref:Alpha/beta hydrolase n=2 Tax=Neokomagataea TaxID=1223423 RepID=A0A4Y6V9K0_9PROT|nr:MULTISPECIES: hypothetical protein [Neokomagataea]QDH25271.1 hypothetical protein D5366_08670 [Neokomagataea tanensis]GBR54250.1 hypothetical protein AA106555_1609 [Neokomagataea thailandica NBRC 106555]
MIVLEGRELVLHHHEGETSYCVLTFTARDQVHLAQTTFFGESVFKKHNISAIGLTTKIDNWFINDEMDHFISKIKELSSKYEKIIAIGPSMGAYPAIKYSKFLNIHRILALAPKWTIDPNLIEAQDPAIKDHLLSGNMIDIFHRVYDDTKKGQCIEADDANGNVIICYDPYSNLDKYNVIKLKSLFSFHEVLFPHCGHIVLDQLYGSENLKNIVHSMSHDEMEVTCSVITKVRRNHKNRIIKSFEVGNERHPYYCFLMLKKFIQKKKSGYKDIISRQYIFSILMDRLIRKNLSSTSTVVELFFRNHWISSVAESKILPVSTEYKKDLFSIMDFHGARIEYSFIDEIITGNNYFFGSRDFCSKVYAKKIGDIIALVTYWDGQIFYLYFNNGKILLTNFSDRNDLLTLSLADKEQSTDESHVNHLVNNIYRIKTPHGYAMSSPGGGMIFHSQFELTWESFSLHPCIDQEAAITSFASEKADNHNNKIQKHSNENKEKKSGFLSRFIR